MCWDAAPSGRVSPARSPACSYSGSWLLPPCLPSSPCLTTNDPPVGDVRRRRIMATSDDLVPVPALIIVVRRRLVIVSCALLSRRLCSALPLSNSGLEVPCVCIYYRLLVGAILYVELRKRRCSLFIYDGPDALTHTEWRTANR